MQPRLLETFRKKVIPELQAEYKYGNSMEVPRLKKIVVSMCVKEATSDIKALEKLQERQIEAFADEDRRREQRESSETALLHYRRQRAVS